MATLLSSLLHLGLTVRGPLRAPAQPTCRSAVPSMVGTQEERFTPDKNVAQTTDTKRDEVMTFSYDMSLDPKYEKPTYPGTGNGLGGEEGEYDVVVIGSGMGGLACGAISAKYGDKVMVIESHIKPGGSVRTCEGTFGVCRLRRHTDERVAFRAPQVFCCIETMMASREQ